MPYFPAVLPLRQLGKTILRHQPHTAKHTAPNARTYNAPHHASRAYIII